VLQLWIASLTLFYSNFAKKPFSFSASFTPRLIVTGGSIAQFESEFAATTATDNRWQQYSSVNPSLRQATGSGHLLRGGDGSFVEVEHFGEHLFEAEAILDELCSGLAEVAVFFGVVEDGHRDFSEAVDVEEVGRVPGFAMLDHLLNRRRG
jgi:hypothetical protein